jgi:hypothetical protein
MLTWRVIDRSSRKALWTRAGECIQPLLNGQPEDDIAEAMHNILSEFMYWRTRCDELKQSLKLREMEIARVKRDAQRRLNRRAYLRRKKKLERERLKRLESGENLESNDATD